LYAVSVERGERLTGAGDRLRYAIYVPEAESTLPPPPWPCVVLLHGFQRDIGKHAYTAEYLAQRGFVVMTPALSSFFTGDSPQTRNVANAVEHVAWLRSRANVPGDSLHGVLDPERVALAGHSAGGAIAFEAAVDMQAAGEPVAAMFLLDVVPWERTVARAPELARLPIAAPRSEPSDCNRWDGAAALRAALSFPIDDLRIVGATHCDAENPTDFLCAAVCEGSSKAAQATYRDLFYLFLAERLSGPLFGNEARDYETAVAELEAAGVIAR
jgi:pimeloyl-ACP methyl ester carboxylesterase